MEYVDALIRALRHIEAHLDEEIDLSDIAREAGYSLYHFHRVFQSVVGESLKEYIRKRRLTEAARTLRGSTRPIADVAVACGYQSREAFVRAFLQAFGFPPSACRRGRHFSDLRLAMPEGALRHAAMRAQDLLTPRFEWLPRRTVAGHVRRFRSDGTNLKDIPDFWEAWIAARGWQQLPAGLYPGESLGIVFPSATQDFDYLIGHEVATGSGLPAQAHRPAHGPDAASGGRMHDHTRLGIREVRELPEGWFAAFPVHGPFTEHVQKTWTWIYSRWLLQSGCRHDGREDIEWYRPEGASEPATLYVPVSAPPQDAVPGSQAGWRKEARA